MLGNWVAASVSTEAFLFILLQSYPHKKFCKNYCKNPGDGSRFSGSYYYVIRFSGDGVSKIPEIFSKIPFLDFIHILEQFQNLENNWTVVLFGSN